MSKKTIIFAGFFLLMGLMFFPGCPTNGDGDGYTLTVSVGAGASGTPTSGSYSYAENSVVNYSYSLQTGYSNLVVTLDGAPMAATGVITVTGNHTLNVTAEQIDIRDAWSGFWDYTGYHSFMRVEFSGALDSGSCGGYFDLLPIGGAGTWTLVGTQIDFSLFFPPPYGYTLVCTGTLTDENHMSGTWILAGVLDGIWSLERL